MQRTQEMGSIPELGLGHQTHSILLPAKSHGQRAQITGHVVTELDALSTNIPW